MVLTPAGDSLRSEVWRGVREFAALGLADVTGYAVAHGNGNVIAIVELGSDHDHALDLLCHATVLLCKAVDTVRVDGVLFFYPAHTAGLRMIFFDRDGTWEALCGNGLRCVARYAADRGLIDGSGVIVTDDGRKPVRVTGQESEVVLGAAREARQVRPDWWFAYTGVPHLVLFVDLAELPDIDVEVEGARLRYDPQLNESLGHPAGVHVDFVAVADEELVVRTYEVGVEAETECCGTGVAAAGYLAWRSGRTDLPVVAHTSGGPVRVDLRQDELTIAGEVAYLLPPVRTDQIGGRS
jgi:diaminopimelate epimerase